MCLLRGQVTWICQNPLSCHLFYHCKPCRTSIGLTGGPTSPRSTRKRRQKTRQKAIRLQAPKTTLYCPNHQSTHYPACPVFCLSSVTIPGHLSKDRDPTRTRGRRARRRVASLLACYVRLLLCSLPQIPAMGPPCLQTYIVQLADGAHTLAQT